MIKYGCSETINDTVFCRGTPFSVAVIVDQVSSCNNMLRDMISEEKNFM